MEVQTARQAEEERKQLEETQIATERVFDGNLLHVDRDRVRLPSGGESGRELIRHVGAVCVVPLNEKNEVIMERQFRYPINEVISEIPAGKLDSKTEDRLEAAKRELREETGLTADSWMVLGELYPTAAYSDEKLTIYLARGLHQGKRELDEDEFLNVHAVPLTELVFQVMRGEILDSKTQIAILKTARFLGI